MKKQSLLNMLFTTTIVILLFYIRTSAEKTENPIPLVLQQQGPTCDYSRIGGFAATANISKSQASASATNYANFASGRGDNILGGVISKSTLDSLFCSGNYNGLAYRLGIDPSGKVAPANSVFVIISGVKIEKKSGNDEIVLQSPNAYIANLWCPPNCASFE